MLNPPWPGFTSSVSCRSAATTRGGAHPPCIDNGVQAEVFHAVLIAALIGLAIVLADWLVNTFETMVVGRNGERLLYILRVKLFAHLQRLGLDFYERELSGRIMTRMTTDVDAFSNLLQTGIIQALVSIMSFFGVLVVLGILSWQHRRAATDSAVAQRHTASLTELPSRADADRSRQVTPQRVSPSLCAKSRVQSCARFARLDRSPPLLAPCPRSKLAPISRSVPH